MLNDPDFIKWVNEKHLENSDERLAYHLEHISLEEYMDENLEFLLKTYREECNANI